MGAFCWRVLKVFRALMFHLVPRCLQCSLILFQSVSTYVVVVSIGLQIIPQQVPFRIEKVYPGIDISMIPLKMTLDQGKVIPMPWWTSLDRRLNPKRMAYAWLAGGILWFAWFLSLLLGGGKFDLAGQVVGTDYVQFYAAGSTLQRGDGAHLYDFEYQKKLERDIVGKTFGGHHAFITPPFFAWVFVPFSLLPYMWSFAIWSLLGLAPLWLSLRWTGASQPGRWFGWALTLFPVFASISFGQNSLLSLGVLSLTYLLWCRERRWLAGLVCSLVLYKPQLALGVGFLWLLELAARFKSVGRIGGRRSVTCRIKLRTLA